MSYDAKHFSVSLPKGDDQANIPNLLRHLASAIEEEKKLEIMDIVFHNEIEQGTEWPNFTVYYVESNE